jgi:hypothetical protein
LSNNYGTGSSLKGSSFDLDKVNLNEFRRYKFSNFPPIADIKMFRVELKQSDLSNLLLMKLPVFCGDENVLNSFVCKWSDILEKYRIFFYSYVHSNDTAENRRISETSYFQPYFRVFLSDMLKDLKLFLYCCENVNHMNLETKMKAALSSQNSLLGSVMKQLSFKKSERELTVCGFTTSLYLIENES